MGLALGFEPERPVSQTWWISIFAHDDQAVKVRRRQHHEHVRKAVNVPDAQNDGAGMLQVVLLLWD